VLLVISGVAIARVVTTRPGRAVAVLSCLLAGAGLAVVALPLAPNFAVAVGAFVAVQAFVSCAQAGILAVAANAIHPAVRTFAFGLTSLSFVLVAPFPPLLGVLGDHFGPRAPLLGTIPIVLAGLVALSAMSRTIERDMAPADLAPAQRA
jgi:MFS family permease